jgi:hypothetical protein
MVRRSIFGLVAAAIAILALAAPALAGGWAVVTLDSLPREVRAGESFQLGFMVLQHGKTPTNMDLNGRPLQPIVTAIKQGGESIRAEARQQGPTGHYLVDLTFPSDGVWDWQIKLPTYYVQSSASGQEGDAAIFAPLTVLPASAAKPAAAPQAPQPAATAPEQPAPLFLGLSPAALRWGGAILLVVAAGAALAAQRGVLGRRLAQPQK